MEGTICCQSHLVKKIVQGEDSGSCICGRSSEDIIGEYNNITNNKVSSMSDVFKEALVMLNSLACGSGCAKYSVLYGHSECDCGKQDLFFRMLKALQKEGKT